MGRITSVVWAERAESQLVDIIEYIAVENLEAAMSLRNRAIEALGRLLTFPESGRRVPELAKSAAVNRTYREVVVPPLRLVYRPDAPETLAIVYVLRSEQRFDPTKLA